MATPVQVPITLAEPALLNNALRVIGFVAGAIWFSPDGDQAKADFVNTVLKGNATELRDRVQKYAAGIALSNNPEVRRSAAKHLSMFDQAMDRARRLGQQGGGKAFEDEVRRANEALGSLYSLSANGAPSDPLWDEINRHVRTALGLPPRSAPVPSNPAENLSPPPSGNLACTLSATEFRADSKVVARIQLTAWVNGQKPPDAPVKLSVRRMTVVNGKRIYAPNAVVLKKNPSVATVVLNATQRSPGQRAGVRFEGKCSLPEIGNVNSIPPSIEIYGPSGSLSKTP
ncbi:hypothetical protein [Noviherbaspirillum humi]|uniref:hypothetical protein n=1 Tax=Noviherbaspirillum humi TaxID=1688639 RepID=UPI001160D157|nr:hypothetical protein [Noviherbaspirillum humi]